MDVTLVYLLLFALFLLLVGYFLPFISKRLGIILSWSIAIITVFYSVVITSSETSLYRMVAIVSLQLLSMKVIVVTQTYSGKNGLNFMQWCAFSLGWFGMRPVLFEKLPSRRLPCTDLMIKGVSRILLGLVLVYLSALPQTSTIKVYFLAELLLLVGLSLILHFGVLNLSAASWRLSGVDVKELFRSPYKSKSLKEFWGKRWNIAFSEMTALIVYRPLKDKISPRMALIASFMVSGVLHEIAISFPVNSGYGLPLTYFAIHAVLIFLEEESQVIKKIIQNPVLAHVWVLGWLICPMPLLFHAGFIECVLMPLRQAVLSLLNF
jgi:hypothetical protein